MQTKLICISAALLGVAGYYTYLNYHYVLTGAMYIAGIILVVIAAIKKDKKDNQIEEIHAEITNNNQKPTESSSSIIKSYMETAHKIEIESYKTNIVSLGRELASKGLAGSGTAIVKNKDLKLSHICNFVNVCMGYADSTKSYYILDKFSVKLLFTDYQNADITDITTIITNQYAARGLTLNETVLSSAISDIENTYKVAL